MPASLPPKVFISHSYADTAVCAELVRRLPEGVRPIVFEPIRVNPDQFVSDRLLPAILDCDGLIYLKGGPSSYSFWVAFERDYALRSGKQVFAADNTTFELTADRSAPLDLAAFASYCSDDQDQVLKIVEYLNRERYFDLWDPHDRLKTGELWDQAISDALENRLKRGGYAVFFWSESASNSGWVLRELQKAAAGISDFNDRVLFALLDKAPVPESWMRFHNPWLQLYGDDQRSTTNRLDDLVVRLYWLIYRNEREKLSIPAVSTSQ